MKCQPREKKLFSGTNIRRRYTREDFRGPGGGESGEKEGGRVGKSSSRVRRGRELAGRVELFPHWVAILVSPVNKLA